jgi:hypothetical protein
MTAERPSELSANNQKRVAFSKVFNIHEQRV